MKKLLVVSIIALMGASLGASAAPNAKKIANGKFLFEDWGCKACHGIGATYNQDAEKGPNLAGVFSRRSADWIKKFSKNPQAMVDAGDKDAVEMSKKYGKVMKTFKISDSEWDDIFEFIKSAGGK
jgi:cytochrome c2